MDDLIQQILAIIPTATFDEHIDDGEIVIYTGLVSAPGGEVVPLDS